MQHSGTPVLMQHLGTEGRVVYVDVDDVETELTAIVGDELIEEIDIDGDRSRKSFRDVIISTDPISEWGGVATPQEDCKVTIDGNDWPIETVEAITGSFARLRVTRSSRRSQYATRLRSERL